MNVKFILFDLPTPMHIPLFLLQPYLTAYPVLWIYNSKTKEAIKYEKKKRQISISRKKRQKFNPYKKTVNKKTAKIYILKKTAKKKRQNIRND